MGFLTAKLTALTRLAAVALFAIVTIAASYTGYLVVRNQIAGDIYRQRLQSLSNDYERLRERYNDAVRRTAATELVVRDGRLSVNVVNAEGVQRTVATPYDPSREIYVDYVVIQGRLWIRRVFDAQTPPGKGLVIEPPLKDLDWSDPRLAVGKAVYRSLTEGRWIVTVTGDGSLGLAKLDHDEPVKLAPLPEVKDYPQLEKEVAGAVDEIGVEDIWRQVVGPKRK